MKPSRLVAVAVLGAGVVLTALILRGRHGQTDAVFDPRFPQHVFVADTKTAEVRPCLFSRVEKGQTLFRTWARPLQPCAVGPGWTHPSEAGIRAFGYRPWIEVFTLEPGLDLLVVTLRSLPHRDPDRRQIVTVFVNGAKIATRELPSEWTTIGLDLPAGTLRRGKNRVEFGFGYRIASTRDDEKKNDPRRFAADLLDLTLAEGTAADLSEGALRRMVEHATAHADVQARVYVPTSGRFRIAEPGELIMPVLLPPGTKRLAMAMTASADLDPSATSIDLAVRVVESGETWSPALPAWQPRFGDGTLEIRAEIPVARCAEVLCVVTTRIGPLPEGAVIEIGPPEPVPDEQTRPTQSLEDTTQFPQPDGPPDIVLVVLDAARYDHFSSSGYHRKTTPNIDRLAAESVVFSSVFALAPYTMCSVPTIITGLSFLEHGVTDRGTSLSADAATLAEQLHAAGYRTLAFSTNPNNSRAAGTDQGYDEFVELWNEESGRLAIDPEVTTSRVLERLATLDDSQPLHLQVHYMPPHAPYEPSPEFNLFTDPGYRGRCDGSHNTINLLDAGRRSPDDGCVEQVVGLYDGGLLAADAAVGRLIDALRARPRWRNTVLLVTSDHGEAFLEHGRMSHNSTVFDEMLHVPFVLRAPDTFDLSRVDTDRLATLADVVPTLLATASLRPVAPTAGKDLTRPAESTRGPDPRFFIARTTGGTPAYALRSTRWKMILTGSGHGELYNLVRDPGETDNLGFVNRPAYVALGALLTSQLASPRGVAGGVMTTVPDSDREMLEALGYVE